MHEDPYFNDIPWEIYYDDAGRVIGALYTLLPKRGDRIVWKETRNKKLDARGNQLSTGQLGESQHQNDQQKPEPID